ncbi:MAG: hypothetical protein KDC10_11295 [Calditrichaeota bacterium]|nr:hypothetical protein [Calditrichota bacterium]
MPPIWRFDAVDLLTSWSQTPVVPTESEAFGDQIEVQHCNHQLGLSVHFAIDEKKNNYRI